MPSPRTALRAALAAASLACAPLSLAQMMPANTPPPAMHPTVVSPIIPITCVPAPQGQPSSCAATTPPLAPTPLPAPPAPKPMVALSRGASSGIAAGDAKVLSYFQRGISHIDTARAFGFVLLPKAAVTDEDANVQDRFCRLMLASLDFMTPEEAAAEQVLVTYWPLVAALEKWQIEAAFRTRDCPNLIAWYDHSLARKIAAKADLTGLSGPLLITWPSANAARAEDREPLIVDFAKADHVRATKALRYWFQQLNQKPELWTSRIHEGTIRAELADAINDTAGVMLAVLYGKWDSVAAVSQTP